MATRWFDTAGTDVAPEEGTLFDEGTGHVPAVRAAAGRRPARARRPTANRRHGPRRVVGDDA